jgi:hypothetical protein
MDACQGDAMKLRGYMPSFTRWWISSRQLCNLKIEMLKEKLHSIFPGNVCFTLDHGTLYLLWGKHFVLYTDHKPLVNLGTIHMKTLSRMQEAMSTYDFEIICQKDRLSKSKCCRFNSDWRWTNGKSSRRQRMDLWHKKVDAQWNPSQ